MLAILAGINLGYRRILGEFYAALNEELGEQLSGLAETFAASIPAEMVSEAIGSESAFSPEAFVRLREQTREFALANRLVSATILDTLWQDPFAAESDSLGAIVFSALDRKGRAALLSGLPWVSETYRWHGAYYRSAAAPISDSSGGPPVGIVRIEADAGYFAAWDQLDSLSWWVHALSVLFALALVGLFIWYGRITRHWEAELLRSEKLIGLGRLAATIAHEIRNPLGIIKATAQRLERLERQPSTDRAHQTELLRFMPAEADRLDRILSGYLRLADPSATHRTSVTMEDELPRWLETLKAGIGGAGRWELQVEPTGPIIVDAEAPRQVLMNLLRNALDISPPEEPVRIQWRPAGPGWGELVVADRGPGIPRRLRQRVFEPFYTTKTTGSGLGLYAVMMMVERDGGTIRIGHNPGGGAVFTVRWPLARDRTSNDRVTG
ncbi:MAG: ATP-binding protein [Candidatus Zixiibacteriota bacterium]